MEELTAEVEGCLQAWRNLILKMGSRHWNIAGPNALVYRETKLKNKNRFTEVRHVFIVHSEKFSNYLHTSFGVHIHKDT